MRSRVVDRRVVRQIDPISAARVTFAMALTLASIALVGLVALYLLALASGALRSVESFISGFGLSQSYHFNLFSFLPGFIAASLFGCGLVAGLGAVGAILYNTLADLVGGVVVVTRER